MNKHYLISALTIFTLFLLSCKDTLIEKIEEFYDDASPKLIRFYKETDGKKILVKEKALYPDGKVQLEGGYKENKRDGLWTYYYENGNKWSESNYDDGENHGVPTTWFENGKKRYEGFYTHGKKSGTWTFWDESGNKVKEVNF